MLRHCFLWLGLLASMIASVGGCRACSSCHDYDPPVANCDCCACGTQRAGSVSGGGCGCCGGGCSTGGCSGCNGGGSSEVYYDGNSQVMEPAMEEEALPRTNAR